MKAIIRKCMNEQQLVSYLDTLLYEELYDMAFRNVMPADYNYFMDNNEHKECLIYCIVEAVTKGYMDPYKYELYYELGG